MIVEDYVKFFVGSLILVAILQGAGVIPIS